MGNYGVVKGFFALLTWIGFGIGALATAGTLVVLMQGSDPFPTLVAGLGIALVGVLCIAVAQIGMAVVATAESSAAIYSLLAKEKG